MSDPEEPADPVPTPRHVPVMVAEVMELLAPSAGEMVVDATVGAGGHASEIARRIGPGGRLVALDRDPSMLAMARARLRASNTTWIEANFAELRAALDQAGVDRVDGILMDLGVASDQIDDAVRGFSFAAPGPLDMRMNPRMGEPAARLVNRLKAENLADIFYQYGEERHSRRVARAIVDARQHRPLETTDELAQVVRRAMPRGKPWQRIDPATRVFQALRIAVNGELDSLQQALDDLPRCLRAGGRAVIISFHSLEDRLVKRAFAQKDLWERLHRKPMVPGPGEVQRNPRSRSAKLRAARLVTTRPTRVR